MAQGQFWDNLVNTFTGGKSGQAEVQVEAQVEIAGQQLDTQLAIAQLQYDPERTAKQVEMVKYVVIGVVSVVIIYFFFKYIIPKLTS